MTKPDFSPVGASVRRNDAKGKVTEQKEQRAAKRAARRSTGDGRRIRLRRGP